MFESEFQIRDILRRMSLKSQYFGIICNLAQLQGGNTKVKFMLRILEKIHLGSKTRFASGINRKVGSRSEKNHSGSTTLIEIKVFPNFLAPFPPTIGQHILCWNSYFGLESEVKSETFGIRQIKRASFNFTTL